MNKVLETVGIDLDAYENDLGSIGATAAMRDMAQHWEDHVQEGCALEDIMGQDIASCIETLQAILHDATVKTTKPEYRIFKREVWKQRVTVEAETLAEAVAIAQSGEEDDDEHAFEYSHTMDTDTWTGQGPNGEYYEPGAIKAASLIT